MLKFDDAVLAEQTTYYRARASEYDEWWRRTGRYDRGPEATERWRSEVDQVETYLKDSNLSGDVLELACGTGWWTERLARTALSLTCIDASPETIELNRIRLTEAELPSPNYEVADLFSWRPNRTFDTVFFSFWLSHVPGHLFDHFWSMVALSLRPGGSAFLIDSVPDLTSGAHDHRPPSEVGLQKRKLKDGRSFRIVKRYDDPVGLTQRLESLGWRAKIRRTQSYFIFGEAARR